MKQYQADRIHLDDTFWKTLAALGICRQAVAAATGLPAAVLLNQQPASTDQYFMLWDSLGRISDDPAIGLAFVDAVDVTQLPPSFFVAHIARDYRDALQRVARFKRLLAPEVIQIEELGSLCHIRLSWAIPDRELPDTLVDATFASLLALGSRNSGERVVAQSVSLTRGSDCTWLAEHLACPARYGAPTNELCLPREQLDFRFRSYNHALLEMLVPQLEQQLGDALYQDRYANQVRWVIGQCLAGGCPSISLVAHELGVSVRTLQRRITAEGCSFKGLLDQVRNEQAKRLLVDSAISLAEVAALLGYENQNSFYRAFRRWQGCGPSRWRLNQVDASS